MLGQKVIDWHQKLTYRIILVCLVWVEDTKRTVSKKKHEKYKAILGVIESM